MKNIVLLALVAVALTAPLNDDAIVPESTQPLADSKMPASDWKMITENEARESARSPLPRFVLLLKHRRRSKNNLSKFISINMLSGSQEFVIVDVFV